MVRMNLLLQIRKRLIGYYENLKKWLNLKYTAKTILLSRSPMDSIDEILDKAEEHIRRIKEGEY